MSLVSFSNIQDTTTIDAADVNTPLNTIFNDYNGNIDSTNIKDGSITNVDIATNTITGNNIATDALIQGQTFIASGKVTNKSTGVDIAVGATSSMYLVYTLGWAGATDGKAGIALCTIIANGFQYVNTVAGGTYSGTVTFTGNTINIKPYAADGCQYLVLRVCQFA